MHSFIISSSSLNRRCIFCPILKTIVTVNHAFLLQIIIYLRHRFGLSMRGCTFWIHLGILKYTVWWVVARLSERSEFLKEHFFYVPTSFWSSSILSFFAVSRFYCCGCIQTRLRHLVQLSSIYFNFLDFRRGIVTQIPVRGICTGCGLTLREIEILNGSWGYDIICNNSIWANFGTLLVLFRVSAGRLRLLYTCF